MHDTSQDRPTTPCTACGGRGWYLAKKLFWNAASGTYECLTNFRCERCNGSGKVNLPPGTVV